MSMFILKVFTLTVLMGDYFFEIALQSVRRIILALLRDYYVGGRWSLFLEQA